MALIVAIAAVVVTVIQGNTQEKLEVVNKQPLLLIEYNKADSQEKKGFLLRNVGFGPAIIESFKFYRNQRDYDNNRSFHKWLDSIGNGVFPMECCFDDINFLNEGYVVTTDQNPALYLLGTDTSFFYNSSTAKYMDSVIIDIQYRSISPFDNNIYYLRYCENFVKNNIRRPSEKHVYEYEETNSTLAGR